MNTSRDQIPAYMGLSFLRVSLDSMTLSPSPYSLYIKYPSKHSEVRKSTVPFIVAIVSLN